MFPLPEAYGRSGLPSLRTNLTINIAVLLSLPKQHRFLGGFLDFSSQQGNAESLWFPPAQKGFSSSVPASLLLQCRTGEGRGRQSDRWFLRHSSCAAVLSRLSAPAPHNRPA